MILEDSDLIKIEGGAIRGLAYGIVVALGSLIAFITGIFDGYSNPVRCKN